MRVAPHSIFVADDIAVGNVHSAYISYSVVDYGYFAVVAPVHTGGEFRKGHLEERMDVDSGICHPHEKFLLYTETTYMVINNPHLHTVTAAVNENVAYLGAECAIDMQFYIFNDDKLGTEISDILIDRSRNGVKVRIIYDHVGCFGVKKKFFMRMADAGIDIHPFFKVTFPEFATRVNWRNHRKITVIDNRIGYIGGMNVADRYVVGDKNGMWRDTHLRITGPSVLNVLKS
jgi:hypothetical protein